MITCRRCVPGLLAILIAVAVLGRGSRAAAPEGRTPGELFAGGGDGGRFPSGPRPADAVSPVDAGLPAPPPERERLARGPRPDVYAGPGHGRAIAAVFPPRPGCAV